MVQNTIATLASIQGSFGLAIISGIQGGPNAAIQGYLSGMALGTLFSVAGRLVPYSWKFGSQAASRIQKYFPGGVSAMQSLSRAVGRPVNLYRYLSGKLITGLEANHLLPKAMFTKIPADDILSVAMEGSKNLLHTEHGAFHAAIDTAAYYAKASGRSITVQKFTREILPDALMNAGIDPYRALRLAEMAEQQALQFYKLADELENVVSGVGR